MLLAAYSLSSSRSTHAGEATCANRRARRHRRAAIFAASSRELAGRRAGVGYSAVAMRRHRGRRSTAARALPRKSLRRNPPSSPRLSRPDGRRQQIRCDGSAAQLARDVEQARRRCRAPRSDCRRWSATTPISSRVSREAQHRAHEIGAERAVDPGGAQDRAARIGRRRPRRSPASFERP